MKFLLSLLIMLCCFEVAGQRVKADYSAVYTFRWVIDTTRMTYAAPEEYLLYKIGNESRFVNKNSHHQDSIVAAFKEKMGANAYSPENVALFFETEAQKVNYSKSNLRVSKDFKRKVHLITLYEPSKREYLQEPMQLDWELQSSTDTIVGLMCYKAQAWHGGRLYTAWYAPQFPIQDGPYIFQGLPGLITKVVDSNNWYEFQLRSFQTNSNVAYFYPPFLSELYTTQLDRKEYIEQSRLLMIDPKLPYGLPNPTPEMLINLREKRKTRFDLIIEKQQ